MPKLLLAAALALPLLTGPAAAEPRLAAGAPQGGESDPVPTASRCLEWPIAMVAAQASNPDASLVKVMDGSLANDFIKVVNALPPVSLFEGDHVALFFKEKADQFLVVIGQNECAKHVVELPAAIFARMVGQPV